ncbi:UDP-4-amino-4,6-dideoxy-N-acetyl-beta-L-altrosamine transaminase [Arenicella xantha]|uniref:UDP-4-amino-4, 6-dideoxy-N-acetyl-beta-L-altrosamine transaminase n=1 Tax=Arenicella xantha TaxID=644221 RepID=A0A395JIN7_9GAMM|nr:UDP-4-amino-4,6-dideoxy-N-acetyl-beta-L-altrosamine transaminase [Arenicella xantha]RBP49885.1 UDP-4-amino-4,6-dideoxy-N-acetyl-beta-L-altrosamine transaminase [Arenicella xantha]
MVSYIPYGRQSINDDDIRAVTDVLTSDFLTQGPEVPRFEDAVRHLVDARHGVAVNSATSALHIACLALGVGPGDRVWTSPITFVASANAALYCGAEIDFVDIDLDTINISVAALESKLKIAKQSGNLPKVVIAVHMCGQSCDMERIFELGREYGFKIIEDASHAIGGYYQNRPIGNCRYSDICVFSFHPVKIITTGEGGMALTNDDKLARRMELLRSHGVTREESEMIDQSDGDWFYQQIDLGFNYRMTDLQAALGRSQLNRLSSFVKERRNQALRYEGLLKNSSIQLPFESEHCHSSYHLFVVRLSIDACKGRSKVFEDMRSANIGVNVHYIPVYKQPYYRRLGFVDNYCENAELYYSQALTLPLYPSLSIADQERVVQVLEEAVLK